MISFTNAQSSGCTEYFVLNGNDSVIIPYQSAENLTNHPDYTLKQLCFHVSSPEWIIIDTQSNTTKNTTRLPKTPLTKVVWSHESISIGIICAAAALLLISILYIIIHHFTQSRRRYHFKQSSWQRDDDKPLHDVEENQIKQNSYRHSIN